MIKAIIFDCFGVLTADSWHEFRLGLPQDQQEEASDLNHQYCRGLLDRKSFIDQVAKLTSNTTKAIEDVIDNDYDKNHQLLKYIAALKKNYKIGLLSNVASNWIRDHFLTLEEQKLFETFVFSYQTGMTKPDPHIFELVAKRLGVELSEAIMVDDIQRYAEAAKATGMQAVCYQDFAQFKAELDQILSQA
ncbi:MAG: HAD-IA family hydrolase [Patescibacteria group bacterium]